MLQIIFAILAGFLTVASPCILPILPIILGVSLGQKNPLRPFFIVLGFIITFTAAALLLAFLTRHIGLNANIIRNIGIFLLGFFGVLLLFPKVFEAITTKLTPVISSVTNIRSDVIEKGNFGGFILGMTLGLIWTPCAGPVLASVLALVALQKDLAAAGILLFFYSLGSAIPMLIIAYGGQFISTRIKAIAPYTQLLQQIFGIIIILLAVALYFNYDTKIYSIILQHYPSINPKL